MDKQQQEEEMKRKIILNKNFTKIVAITTSD